MSTCSNQLQPALQNLLQCVIQFFHPKSSCKTTHISADVHRITLNASCMTISGGRTEQHSLLQVFCRVTGFTSDFLSFIVVEHIRFFHGSLPSCYPLAGSPQPLQTECLYCMFMSEWVNFFVSYIKTPHPYCLPPRIILNQHDPGSA